MTRVDGAQYAATASERRVLELVLPSFRPSNTLSLNGRRRAHWRQVWDAGVEVSWYMSIALDARPLPHFNRARVTCTFVYPTHRRRDPDGLAGLCKPILDSLVNWNVLPDDTTEHVELAVRAIVEKGVTETRIRIEELEP
jgi:hypothetical protein